jgi:rod shape-determining protein MreC
MQTNRDDFIIAIRSAFLKKGNQQRFSLIALILFSIFIIVLGKYNFKGVNFLKLSIKEVVYRTTFIVSVPENFVISSYQTINDHFSLYSNYKNLKKDYESLKATKLNADFLKSENEALKSKIDDVSTQSSVIVNRGSKDNVILGMAVLDEKFLVGKVVEVNYSTSRVLLLSDLNSKIPVSIEPNGVQSILSGSGSSYGEIQYIKEDYELENDSEIFTSGSGGIFRSGIPIGKTIANEEIGLDTIKVKFHSDFSQLRLVKIVSFEEVKQND